MDMWKMETMKRLACEQLNVVLILSFSFVWLMIIGGQYYSESTFHILQFPGAFAYFGFVSHTKCLLIKKKKTERLACREERKRKWIKCNRILFHLKFLINKSKIRLALNRVLSFRSPELPNWKKWLMTASTARLTTTSILNDANIHYIFIFTVIYIMQTGANAA